MEAAPKDENKTERRNTRGAPVLALARPALVPATASHQLQGRHLGEGYGEDDSRRFVHENRAEHAAPVHLRRPVAYHHAVRWSAQRQCASESATATTAGAADGAATPAQRRWRGAHSGATDVHLDVVVKFGKVEALQRDLAADVQRLPTPAAPAVSAAGNPRRLSPQDPPTAPGGAALPAGATNDVVRGPASS